MNKEESLKQLNEQIQELERKRDAIKADIANDDYQDFYYAFLFWPDEWYVIEPTLEKVRAKFHDVSKYTKVVNYITTDYHCFDRAFLFKTKSEAISYLREKAAELQREINDKIHSKIDEYEENEDL